MVAIGIVIGLVIIATRDAEALAAREQQPSADGRVRVAVCLPADDG